MANTLTRGMRAVQAVGGKVVSVGKNSITMFLPKGGSKKLKMMNPGVKLKNVEMGFYDGMNRFHPIRSSWDYDVTRAGEFSDDPRDIVFKKKTKRSAELSPATKRKRTLARKAQEYNESLAKAIRAAGTARRAKEKAAAGAAAKTSRTRKKK